jgi:hypothetical protein
VGDVRGLKFDVGDALVSVAQAISLALAGAGTAVISSLALFAGSDACLWLVFLSKTPFKSGKDLIQVIGVCVGVFLLVSVLVSKLDRPYSSRVSWLPGDVFVWLSLVGGIAGCSWGRAIAGGISSRIVVGRTMRLLGFVPLVICAGAGLGSGVGFMVGLQGQVARSGASKDAAVLGFFMGPLVVGAVYVLIRPVKISGGIAAFIVVAVAVIGILSAAVFGPLAAVITSFTAVALAFAARVLEADDSDLTIEAGKN